MDSIILVWMNYAATMTNTERKIKLVVVHYSTFAPLRTPHVFFRLLVSGNFRETSGAPKRSDENGRRPTMEAGGVKAIRRPRAPYRGMGVFFCVSLFLFLFLPECSVCLFFCVPLCCHSCLF